MNKIDQPQTIDSQKWLNTLEEKWVVDSYKKKIITKFLNFFQNQKDPIWIGNENWETIWVNKNFLDLLGYETLRDIEGLNEKGLWAQNDDCWVLYDKDSINWTSREKVQEANGKGLEQGKTVNYKAHIKDKDKELIPVEVESVPLEEFDTDLEWWTMGHIRSIEKEKKLEKENKEIKEEKIKYNLFGKVVTGLVYIGFLTSIVTNLAIWGNQIQTEKSLRKSISSEVTSEAILEAQKQVEQDIDSLLTTIEEQENTIKELEDQDPEISTQYVLAPRTRVKIDNKVTSPIGLIFETKLWFIGPQDKKRIQEIGNRKINGNVKIEDITKDVNYNVIRPDTEMTIRDENWKEATMSLQKFLSYFDKNDDTRVYIKSIDVGGEWELITQEILKVSQLYNILEWELN